MKKHVLISSLILLSLSGCASKQVVDIKMPFDKAAAEKQMEPGNNTINGSALIRQQGGGVVTCAGRQVLLVPATAYATARMMALYGPADTGFASYNEFTGKRVTFTSTAPDYAKYMKHATCDAQGYFKFRDVADGIFYITTGIGWKVSAYNTQGGALMRKVKVSGGETIDTVLTY